MPDGLCRTPVLPAYVIEAYYEGEHAMTRTQLRQQDYQAVLSCIGGYVFGNLPLWDFDTGWQACDGCRGIGGLAAGRGAAGQCGVVEPGAVEPGDAAGTVLVTGGGDIAPRGRRCGSGERHDAAGIPAVDGNGDADDHGPDGGAGGPSRGRWYNPTSGIYIDITGGAYTLANRGTHAFTTPGNNGTGTNDWVLVLDTSGPVPVSYQGIWWNAPANSESGWGLNIAHQADTLFAIMRSDTYSDHQPRSSLRSMTQPIGTSARIPA